MKNTLQELYIYKIEDEMIFFDRIIDNFISVIWNEKMNEIGSCEIYLPFSLENQEIFTEGTIITKQHQNKFEKVTAMIVDQIKIEEKNGKEFMTVYCSTALKFLKQRIIWDIMTFQNKTIEYIVSALMDSCIYVPTDNNRKIEFISKNLQTLDCNVVDTKQFTGKNLYTSILDMCNTNKLCQKVELVANEVGVLYLAYSLYPQTDVKNEIIFSNEFDNIYNSNFAESYKDKINCCLVAGEGEGSDRIKAETNDGSVGSKRYEEYLELTDVPAAEFLLPENYLESLKSRGKEAFTNVTQAFDTELIYNMYEYKIDYNLGYIVTVNKYNHLFYPIISEIIEKFDEKGYTLTPIFTY